MENHVTSVRTQLYFPYDLHQEVLARAKKQGLSFAAQVRKELTKTKKVKRVKNDLLQYSGIIKDETATDISINSAKYLKQMYEELYP
jgi:hypothetical protein